MRSVNLCFGPRHDLYTADFGTVTVTVYGILAGFCAQYRLLLSGQMALHNKHCTYFGVSSEQVE